MISNKHNSFWLGTSLVGLILITRSSHFGTGFLLPDATLAALFLIGMLMHKVRWLAIGIAIAFAVDFYELGFTGFSNYFISLGYWGLIPTYAMVWGSGRYIAKQEKPFALTIFVPAAWLSTTLAFILSNAFWYVFSDKVSTLTVLEFSTHVAQYYTPYLSYTVLYLGLAWLAQVGFQKLSLRQRAVV